MALKDIVQRMQGMVDHVTARREEGQTPQRSVMPNGSVSGHQPVLGPKKSIFGSFGRKHREEDEAEATAMPPLQPNVPPRPMAQSAAPQQPYGNQATSQQMPPPQHNARANWNQRSQGGGWTQSFGTMNQPPVQNQPAQGTMNQPPVQPSQQMPPVQPVQQAPKGTVYDFVTGMPQEVNNAYAMVLRVVQITGIPSCYPLLEFMKRDEAVIVNAEQITDQLEVNRCMDMLFGAASAMNKHFERIAGRMIYLIAPLNVHVVPSDSVMQISQSDRERRWPGSSRSGAQAARNDDFQPRFGQRAQAPQQAQFTDYGGFNGFSSRR